MLRMRSANFTNKMAYAESFCHSLVIHDTINLDARHLVGSLHICNSTKNNILDQKGAWSGLRDLLFFKILGPLRIFNG